MRIVNAKLNNKNFNFLKEKDLTDNNNKYTIILGENGTGKSELLRQIINNLLRIKILNISPEHNELGKFSFIGLLKFLPNFKYVNVSGKHLFIDLLKFLPNSKCFNELGNLFFVVLLLKLLPKYIFSKPIILFH